MKIDDLDGRMRAFETVLDPCVLPGVWMVARLDNFTRLTKEVHPFEAPFDPRFHDYMRQTAEHLMVGGGLGVVYAFTQSDEISLLCGPQEGGFGRRLRKLLSVLSGEAAPGSRCCWGRRRRSTAASRHSPRRRTSSITSAGGARTLAATP